MTLEQIDLTALANLVLQDLRRKHPERSGLQTKVTAGLQAWGDAALLRIAMENLLGNAWKFTSKTAEARIVFAAVPDTNPTIFIVRDNGAGFDMAYASKLFAPFQRLHTVEEFPGTGIGLAITKKIIERHGGTIEVESSPEHGTTMSFTLPDRSRRMT